jgi:hypothetical protein
LGAKEIDRSTGYADAAYYFDFRFFRTFEYVGCPWIPDPQFAIGLRHQCLASGRKLGIVAPVPNVPVEHGYATDPAFLAELLEEIVAYEYVAAFVMKARGGKSKGALHFRLPPLPTSPGLGRVALSAFSNGNYDLATLVGKLGGSPMSGKACEIYAMDPYYNGSVNPQDVLGRSSRYLRGLPSDKVALRHYSQFPYLGLASKILEAVDPGRPATRAFDATSERVDPPQSKLGEIGHMTNAFLPLAAWNAAFKPEGTGINWQIHSMIPSTMFTHALRLSQFPAR